MKKKILIFSAIIACLVVGVVLGVIALLEWYPQYKENDWYITNDISTYGQITHNNQNGIVEDFVDQFFPEKIEPYFENVQYSYKARQWCDYGCEISLDITISDFETYQNYVKEITAGFEGKSFVWDNRFQDYTIADKLFVDRDDVSDDGGYYLDDAKMGRILVCEEEQRIIFYAIMVPSCCGTNTNNFAFYSKFAIDPLAYS